MGEKWEYVIKGKGKQKKGLNKINEIWDQVRYWVAVSEDGKCELYS